MLKKILSISILKTVMFNLRYFGIGGLIHTYIICSRQVLIKDLDGAVTLGRRERGIIRIGFGEVEVIDGKRNRAIWSNKGSIHFIGDAHFCKGAKIIVKENASITFGDHFILNGDTKLIARKNITFGNDCLLSWGGLIMDTDFHSLYTTDDIEKKTINEDREAHIGNHCWLGCNVIVMKGVNLADNTIVSAGSVIKKMHVTPNCILVGDEVVKEKINWNY